MLLFLFVFALTSILVFVYVLFIHNSKPQRNLRRYWKRCGALCVRNFQAGQMSKSLSTKLAKLVRNSNSNFYKSCTCDFVCKAMLVLIAVLCIAILNAIVVYAVSYDFANRNQSSSSQSSAGNNNSTSFPYSVGIIQAVVMALVAAVIQCLTKPKTCIYVIHVMKEVAKEVTDSFISFDIETSHVFTVEHKDFLKLLQKKQIELYTNETGNSELELSKPNLFAYWYEADVIKEGDEVKLYIGPNILESAIDQFEKFSTNQTLYVLKYSAYSKLGITDFD